MNRAGFVASLGAAVLTVAALPRDIEIPVELRGGRFFAVPRVADGRVFACWLDTDGSGFIFDAAVDAFHLSTHIVDSKRRAALPAFASPSIPPLSKAKDLPVFERAAQDRADQILQGFDAQLGRTWFNGRTWRFDWPARTCTMLGGMLEAADANVPLRIEGGYTRITAEIAGERLLMSFDIAASVALKPDGMVSATTFVAQAVLDRWHKANPNWVMERNVGIVPGIDRIIVPEMRVGTATLRDVACTTRPGDDVFESQDVRGKLGANAFAGCVAVLDYRTSRLKLC